MAEVKEKPSVEAGLGVSEKWDAREAGREVAETAIKGLSRPPDFFLLFSTIHYEKHGGFQEFLNGVWDVLPEGTPLVGGTVVGFMNNYGCYTHGATALAVSYPYMDVAVGYGRNTKRNPKRAARQCAEMIKKGLAGSTYKNKFLFNLVSGPVFIKIPGYGYKKVIDSGLTSKFVISAIKLSRFLVQRGAAREDEVFEEIVRNLPDYYMILGTTLDNLKGICNYQFFNDMIFTNSVVNLGLATNLNINVCTTHGMKETDIKFQITKLRNNQIIQKINNKPALEELYRLLDWPEGFVNDKTMEHTILYYPILLKRGEQEVPVVMPFILKNSIMTPCLIDKGEAKVLTVSGKSLVNSVQGCLPYSGDTQPEFGLFSNCMTILQALGSKVNLIRDETIKSFGKKPFLMIWSAGEGTYAPKPLFTYANMSFNSAIFGVKR
ncbi:MAG: FIST N-terminal domain-containing protein [Candidatus Thermoplasmatota archaeon]